MKQMSHRKAGTGNAKEKLRNADREGPQGRATISAGLAYSVYGRMGALSVGISGAPFFPFKCFFILRKRASNLGTEEQCWARATFLVRATATCATF